MQAYKSAEPLSQVYPKSNEDLIDGRAEEFTEGTDSPQRQANEGTPPKVGEDSDSEIIVREGTLCSACGQYLRPGELICPSCGSVVSNALRTRKLDESKTEPTRRVGAAIMNELKPLKIEIAGQTFQLSAIARIELGRAVDLPGEKQPNVDLTPFQADERGVSRHHIVITRDHDLVRVTDLNSTNGTFLNGFRLQPNQARLLRSGDELILGKLRMVVRF